MPTPFGRGGLVDLFGAGEVLDGESGGVEECDVVGTSSALLSDR